jgi:glycosyltransferase involved in cell wall biosynthesis
MKFLLCHNYYRQRGGEDESFESEAALLESRGHSVVRFTVHNQEIDGMSNWTLARQTLWNRKTGKALRKIIQAEKPTLMHCTNIFPLLSPAIYSAAKAEKIAVVQSVRNFRAGCLNALLLHKGSVCEDCLGKIFPWRGIVRGCYRESRAASSVVATSLTLQRLAQKWSRFVDLYFAPTEFARKKLIEAGLPKDRTVVKPNFVGTDPCQGDGQAGFAVFLGRLAPEKGIDTLLKAWTLLRHPIQLKIIGDGPLAEHVEHATTVDPRIQWLGRLPHNDVLPILGDAMCLVMPSIWYETFGRSIIEAYAKGTPVIASELGAMSELVKDGKTGWYFPPGDARALANRIEWLVENPVERAIMRDSARCEFLEKYTAERNYDMLMEIYERAVSLSLGSKR